MKGVKQPFGYTIVEVMIVLAVSGVMFLIAANFISGKQEKTTFQQGSNELVSRIQGLIEQVTDGQYTDIPITCTSNGATLNISGASVPDQGTNADCVFLGKMMHFSVGGEKNKYEVFSLAGTRLKVDGTPAITLAETRLTPVANASVNLTSKYNTPQNLDITSTKIVQLNADGSTTTWNDKYAFGFMQGLGTVGATLGSYKSGAQSLNVIFANSVNGNQPELTASGNINTGTVRVAKSVCLVLYDGTRGALVNVGADNGNQLNVSVKQLGVVGAAPSCP